MLSETNIQNSNITSLINDQRRAFKVCKNHTEDIGGGDATSSIANVPFTSINTFLSLL